MDSDLKKLRKTVRFMREHGLLKVKTPEMELELSPSAIFPESGKKPQADNAPSEVETQDEFSEEDKLFWSSPASYPLAPSEEHA